MRPRVTLASLLAYQALVPLVLVGPLMADDRGSWFWLFLVAVAIWECFLIRDFVRWRRSQPARTL